MEFEEYRKFAAKTAIYPESLNVLYPCLGLAGETGEVCEKIKKVYRDQGGKFEVSNKIAIVKELGDVLWYIAAIATDLDLNLNIIAENNIKKLQQRQKNGTISGSGDNR